MSRFDKTVNALKDISSSLSTIKQGSGTRLTSAAGAGTAALSPEAVASALAQAMKSDNSTTQAIAIRAAQLAAKYPQRAA